MRFAQHAQILYYIHLIYSFITYKHIIYIYIYSKAFSYKCEALSGLNLLVYEALSCLLLSPRARARTHTQTHTHTHTHMPVAVAEHADILLLALLLCVRGLDELVQLRSKVFVYC
jgi:hypothetical protein